MTFWNLNKINCSNCVIWKKFQEHTSPFIFVDNSNVLFYNFFF